MRWTESLQRDAGVQKVVKAHGTADVCAEKQDGTQEE